MSRSDPKGAYRFGCIWQFSPASPAQPRERAVFPGCALSTAPGSHLWTIRLHRPTATKNRTAVVANKRRTMAHSSSPSWPSGSTPNTSSIQLGQLRVIADKAAVATAKLTVIQNRRGSLDLPTRRFSSNGWIRPLQNCADMRHPAQRGDRWRT